LQGFLWRRNVTSVVLAPGPIGHLTIIYHICGRLAASMEGQVSFAEISVVTVAVSPPSAAAVRSRTRGVTEAAAFGLRCTRCEPCLYGVYQRTSRGLSWAKLRMIGVPTQT
jgi:hypothetical protein